MTEPDPVSTVRTSEEPLAPVISDEGKGLPALVWGSGIIIAVVVLVAYLLLQ